MKTFFKVLFFITMLLPVQLKAQNPIANAINYNRRKLHFPRSVMRFYELEGYRLVWVLKDTIKTPAWDAMQLLDCVLQYGLDPNDYHPQQLTYQFLNAVQQDKATNNDKAYFDVMMTDALINLINNLHYGKFNPDFQKSRIDAADITEFKGDKILVDALENHDLMAIINVQPHAEAYTNLRRHLLLLTTNTLAVIISNQKEISVN
jgi:hypothetical protein